MDIFIRNIPPQCTYKQLTDFLRQPLQQLAISTFHCRKMKGKGCAILTIADHNRAEAFLSSHGFTQDPRPGAMPAQPLVFSRRTLICTPSKNKVDELMLRALQMEENTNQENTKPVSTEQATQPTHRTFHFSTISRGQWDYVDTHLVFVPYYHDSRSGSILFGKSSLVILLHTGSIDDWQVRLDMPSWSIDHIVTSNNYASPTVSLTLLSAPKVYKPNTLGELTLEELLKMISLSSPRQQKHIPKRIRMPSLDSPPMQDGVTGSCFIYQIYLTDKNQLSDVHQLLNRHKGMPSSISWPIDTLNPRQPLRAGVEMLQSALQDHNQYGQMPFALRFQIQRLASNGYLAASKVQLLLPAVQRLLSRYGEVASVEAVRLLARHLPTRGPHTEAKSFENDTIVADLEKFAQSYIEEGSYTDVVRRHSHLTLVHRVLVTPTGTYLEGPEPEVGNRVLRKFKKHTEHFIRVTFSDEDGQAVHYDPRASLHEIFARFKSIMKGTINIAGHGYAFLGFSHSSLRSQTCWFMAPFIQNGELIHAPEAIKRLGDFSHIQSPARCAARIGQTFSDTNGVVPIPANAFDTMDDVGRNGRTFSDGVGIISTQLLRKVWQEYALSKNLKPTALQIRFGGAKGVVSLDSTLEGEKLYLRRSMIKFGGADTWAIEICGANFQPLPLYLNRQFIKILEDLGVDAEVFLDLQADMVERLRRITLSPVNAATFLELNHVGTAARAPSLIRNLSDIGLSFQEDGFLRSVVEITALAQLLDIKHRSRILVEDGVTLYGIMDETGLLQEGEIYCVTETATGGRLVLTGGQVAITRAPALHPGDIRVVKAVDVPAGSPLNDLHNCVVFSQHGDRDLPSQLSGGDLDGDLYNVIFDKRLMPKTTYAPADYPRAEPEDIGREVTKDDMADFFIQFMETDQLGRIATMHQQLADRHPEGTLHPDCILLAEMASRAVDFSKTGIPVDLSCLPKSDKIRPDFMSGGPRVIIEKKGVLFVEEDGQQDHDDDGINALDPDDKPYRYYESDRVLGKLYRSIDERQFLEDIQKHTQSHIELGKGTDTLMKTL